MNFSRTWILFIVGISCSACVLAQNINKEKLDSLFNILEENQKAMGTVVISQGGAEVYHKSIGFSVYSDDEKIAADENTKYRIASVSKIFTATLIFQLIEAGKLSLTSTLSAYFPNIPNSKLITVSELLSHRTGLQNFRTVAGRRKNKTHEQMLAIIVKSKIEFPPNSEASYSNVNFLLLGYIIEKIYNRAYKDILYDKIISKLGLQNTYYGSKPDIKNNESYSYKFKNKWRHHLESNMSIAGGSGGIVSTPSDLTHFMEALFLNKLINQKSLSEMTTPRDGYGLGILQLPFYSKTVFGYYGGIDAYSSLLAYFPADSLAIAFCSNGLAYPIENIISGALNIYFGREYVIPDLKSPPYKPGNLKKYFGIYYSKQTSFKITISKKNSWLIAATNKNLSYRLYAIAKNTFTFEPNGVVMRFNQMKHELILKQNGMEYLFPKVK